MRLAERFTRRSACIAVLSLIWLAVLVFDLSPWLRGGFGWRWPFEPVLDLGRSGPFILGVLVYVPVALALERRRNVRGLLGWSLAGAIGLALAAVHVRDDVLFRLFTITIAGGTGGWHMAATRIDDLIATLRAWPVFMVDSGAFSSHMVISPPGMVTIYYGAIAALARVPALAGPLADPLRALQCQDLATMRDSDAQLAAAWLGMLGPLWAGLTALALYRFARGVFGEGPARWSVVWWPLVPSLLMFAPLPNTWYPLFAVIMIGLLTEGLRRDRPVWVLASGLLMSAMTFVTFAFSPLALLAGFLTLGFFWLKRTGAQGKPVAWWWPIAMGAVYGAGLAVVWVLVYVASGLTPWDVLRTATQAHLDLHRSYWPWLILHLNDFFMFTGWPLALLAGVGVWLAVSRLRTRQPWRESDVMILAATLALIVLDLSGTLRGESGRILLYLAPWLLLAAAFALDDDRRTAVTLTVVQAACAIAMVVCLRVLDSGHVHPPAAPPPPVAALAPGVQPTPNGARFGDFARLASFAGKIEMRPGADGQARPVLLLWLNWEPVGTTGIPYYLAVLPVAPDGEAAPQAELQQPFRLQYPTTCWRPANGAMQDQIEVPLFAVRDGDWWVSLQLVDGRTGEALPVVNADGSQDTQVGLGPLR